MTIRTRIGIGTRVNGIIQVKGAGDCVIGNYCAIGEEVKIITSNHNLDTPILQYALSRKLGLPDPVAKTKGVEIGHNVWIGDRVIILPGVVVGNGAVLAAGAIVTQDVKPYTIVGGVPAKKINSRLSESKQKELEDSKWWEWPIEEMKKNDSLFDI